MKATMNKEEYRYFTESLVIIKEKSGIDIAHTVEYQGDNFIVTILDDVNLNKIDNLLDIEWVLVYDVQHDIEQPKNFKPSISKCKRFGLASVHDSESSQLETLSIFNELLTKP